MSVNLTPLLELLRARAVQVRDLEARAGRRLSDEDDREGYAALLVLKARLLADLAEDVAGQLGAITEGLKSEVLEAVGAISDDADQALAIGSVFYMSALLYEPGSQPGDSNALEQVILLLEKK